MINKTQRTSALDAGIAAYTKVSELIKLGAKDGIIAEITIRPGWLARYDKLSQAERASLSTKPPTRATFDAALKFAGGGPREELIAEFAARVDVQEIESRIREMGLTPTDTKKAAPKGLPQRVTEAIAQRPKLVDTPKTRKAAFDAMGINV